MRKLFYLFIAVIFLGFTACNTASKKGGDATEGEGAETVAEEAPINTLTEEEKEKGWILMFDGKDTNGWRGYNKETFPDSGWQVVDGTLMCEHSGTGEAGYGGDIIYDKQFTNFDLKLEWMIEEGGNAGIFFLAQEVPGWEIWRTAPEYQILDNFSDHPDNQLGVNGNRRAGSLYDLIPPNPQNAKGAMEWNTAEIYCYDGTVFFRMNGEKTLEFHLWTPEWNEMIANSKFPEYNPDWANVAKTGYIGLQDHGHAVWFRNIKIRELQ